MQKSKSVSVISNSTASQCEVPITSQITHKYRSHNDDQNFIFNFLIIECKNQNLPVLSLITQLSQCDVPMMSQVSQSQWWPKHHFLCSSLYNFQVTTISQFHYEIKITNFLDICNSSQNGMYRWHNYLE